jgi:hypothetical protein
MNSNIVPAKDLNIEQTVFTVPKINKNTKQLGAMIKDVKTNNVLFIETPYCIAPFGASSFEGGTKGLSDDAKSWSIAIKAQGYSQDLENQENITKFFEFAKAIDEKAIDYGITHSQSIFSKKYDENQRSIVADALFTRCIKPSGVDPNTGNLWPDKLSLKVVRNKETSLPDVMIFKDSLEPVNIDSWDTLKNVITKGCCMKAIVEFRLYFLNKKFGINVRVIQIKLLSIDRPGKPTSYAFSEALIKNDNDRAETKLIKNNETVVDKEKLKNDKDDNEVNDSDEDVDVEDENI